jgi:recombination associated protein RdgC
MFFRNLTLFRFPLTLVKALSDLDTALADCVLKPVGPLEMGSRGFVPPFGGDSEALVHGVGAARWLTVGSEDRLLPSTVVNAELEKRLLAPEAKDGRKPGSKTRRRMKEDLVHELLPRAFVRPSRLDAMLDLKHGVLAVDTSSRKAAENMASELRRAWAASRRCRSMRKSRRACCSPAGSRRAAAAGFALGDECELKDPVDGGAVLKCQRQELLSDEIGKHLESGKQVTEAGAGVRRPPELRARRGPGAAQAEVPRRRRGPAREHRTRLAGGRAGRALRADVGGAGATVRGAGAGPAVQPRGSCLSAAGARGLESGDGRHAASERGTDRALLRRLRGARRRRDGRVLRARRQLRGSGVHLDGRDEIASMWAMLCAATRDRGRDVWRLEASDIHADADSGRAHWEAHYRFSATGRLVHNRIDASFRFRDGLIVGHVDRFDFWPGRGRRWARPACCWAGRRCCATRCARRRRRSWCCSGRAADAQLAARPGFEQALPPEDSVRALVLASGESVPVRWVREARARRLRLIVNERGVRLTLPRGASIRLAETFVFEHRDWIAEQLAKRRPARASPSCSARNANCRCAAKRGASTGARAATCAWRSRRRHRHHPARARQRPPAARGAEGLLPRAGARRPRRLAAQVPARAAGGAGEPAPARAVLAVGLAQRQRRAAAGPGAGAGPASAFEYVLVHELCHLLHRNHSRRYWREVEKRWPQWRDEREYLHGEGLALKAELRRLIAK